MAVIVGYAGEGIRADVQITVEDAPEFGFTFQSSTSPLYDGLIRQQIESVAKEWGCPACHLACQDSGALPFTWRARLNTAFRLFFDREPRKVAFVKAGARPRRLCRTRLYVPGNTPKLFPNATLSSPDAVILDLEESVPDQRKAEALDLVVEGVASLDWSACELMVRINPGEAGFAELRRLAESPVETFVVPKVERPEQLIELDHILGCLGSEQRLIPLIESALGVENAFAIASATPRVRGLSLGLEDYLRDLGAVRTSEQFESAYARSRVLNAARAAGVTPLASVFPGFEDVGPLADYVRNARDQGYEGVGCIHPSQVRHVHEAFSPTPEEFDQARQVVEAFESASRAGLGATSANGKMVDRPTYERALKVIARAGGPR